MRIVAHCCLLLLIVAYTPQTRPPPPPPYSNCSHHMPEPHARATCPNHMPEPHARTTCPNHVPEPRARTTCPNHVPEPRARTTRRRFGKRSEVSTAHEPCIWVSRCIWPNRSGCSRSNWQPPTSAARLPRCATGCVMQRTLDPTCHGDSSPFCRFHPVVQAWFGHVVRAVPEPCLK